jgi:hypothetical protein
MCLLDSDWVKTSHTFLCEPFWGSSSLASPLSEFSASSYWAVKSNWKFKQLLSACSHKWGVKTDLLQLSVDFESLLDFTPFYQNTMLNSLIPSSFPKTINLISNTMIYSLIPSSFPKTINLISNTMLYSLIPLSFPKTIKPHFCTCILQQYVARVSKVQVSQLESWKVSLTVVTIGSCSCPT